MRVWFVSVLFPGVPLKRLQASLDQGPDPEAGLQAELLCVVQCMQPADGADAGHGGCSQRLVDNGVIISARHLASFELRVGLKG